MELILSAQNLTKTFDPGTHAEVKAVQGINLELPKGDIVLIMGPSGSGKTSLLTMFGGLLSPSVGKITLAGQEIERLGGNALTRLRRHNVGFIFQSFNLLENLTALENVIVGSFSSDRRQKAKALLKRLGMESRMRSKPNKLSGGERQRVAIARALINDPPLILADEPTANLDSITGHSVMELLCETVCSEGRALIIVSHDERLRDVAKRVITIEDGKLVKEERGGHETSCSMEHHHE